MVAVTCHAPAGGTDAPVGSVVSFENGRGAHNATAAMSAHKETPRPARTAARRNGMAASGLTIAAVLAASANTRSLTYGGRGRASCSNSSAVMRTFLNS